MTTQYKRGAAFERKVRDKEYADGATLVVRSAGSRGAIDLVSFYPDRIKLIQVKNNGVLGAAERMKLGSVVNSLTRLPVQTYLAYRSTGGITMKQLSFGRHRDFCEGGTETCEHCVGSCGIEEYEASGGRAVGQKEAPDERRSP